MEEVIEALEENAGKLDADIDTASIMLQEKADQAIRYGQESHVYNLRRGEIRREVEKLEDKYRKAKAIIELGDQLDLTSSNELREEEAGLAKRKWFKTGINNPYTGPIKEAIAEHQERQEEAKKQDLLTHSTPIHSLRNTVNKYEEFLYHINEEITGIDLETPYTPKEHDGEIVEETTTNTEVEQVYEPGNMWETI